VRKAFLVVCLLAATCVPKGSSKRSFASYAPEEAELMQADREFARDTLARGVDGWVDAFADDGVALPESAPFARGKEALRGTILALLVDPTNRLRWQPSEASVSASGDLGYTLGHATVGKVDRAGHEIVIGKMKYTTIWKRQLDGRWKVAVNVGTPEP
jgi:ketosteroid isomerase-like protein